MSTHIDDRVLWLGLGIATYLSIKGAAYVIAQLVLLGPSFNKPRPRSKPVEPGEPPDPQDFQDALRLIDDISDTRFRSLRRDRPRWQGRRWRERPRSSHANPLTSHASGFPGSFFPGNLPRADAHARDGGDDDGNNDNNDIDIDTSDPGSNADTDTDADTDTGSDSDYDNDTSTSCMSTATPLSRRSSPPPHGPNSPPHAPSAADEISTASLAALATHPYNPAIRLRAQQLFARRFARRPDAVVLLARQMDGLPVKLEAAAWSDASSSAAGGSEDGDGGSVRSLGSWDREEGDGEGEGRGGAGGGEGEGEEGEDEARRARERERARERARLEELDVPVPSVRHVELVARYGLSPAAQRRLLGGDVVSGGGMCRDQQQQRGMGREGDSERTVSMEEVAEAMSRRYPAKEMLMGLGQWGTVQTEMAWLRAARFVLVGRDRAAVPSGSDEQDDGNGVVEPEGAVRGTFRARRRRRAVSEEPEELERRRRRREAVAVRPTGGDGPWSQEDIFQRRGTDELVVGSGTADAVTHPSELPNP